MRTSLLLSLGLLLSTAAVAQPTPPRSPATAVLVSTAATAASLGLAAGVYALDGKRGGLRDAGPIAFAVAATLAPSAGNVVLGEFDDASVGLGLRIVGMGAMAYGASNVSLVGDDGPGAYPALLGGAAVFLVGLGYDAVTQVRNDQGARVQFRPTGAGLSLTVGL